MLYGVVMQLVYYFAAGVVSRYTHVVRTLNFCIELQALSAILRSRRSQIAVQLAEFPFSLFQALDIFSAMKSARSDHEERAHGAQLQPKISRRQESIQHTATAP